MPQKLSNIAKSPKTNSIPITQISIERKTKVNYTNGIPSFKSVQQVSNTNLPIDQRFVNS